MQRFSVDEKACLEVLQDGAEEESEREVMGGVRGQQPAVRQALSRASLRIADFPLFRSDELHFTPTPT